MGYYHHRMWRLLVGGGFMKENKEAKYYEKVMDSTLIVQEYIFYSEMEGELDYDDPWMALYNGLSELRGKLADEKEMSEMNDMYMDGTLYDC